MSLRNFRLSKTNRDSVFIDCKTHCATKSLSIDLWNDVSKDFICNLHSNPSVGIAPAFRSQLVVFKIKKGGGLIKPTPTRKNLYHHDFYTPDNFDENTDSNSCLEYIETIKLNYNDV